MQRSISVTQAAAHGRSAAVEREEARASRRRAAEREAEADGAAVFSRRTRVEASAEEVFRWHARPGAFERLTPPWAPAQVESRTGGIEAGARVVLRLPAGPLSVRWVAEHTDYEEGHLFRDVQVQGPFARWEHTHRFEAAGRDASILEDRVLYALPFGALGAAANRFFVAGMLERMFAYRHRITAGDVAAHARYRAHGPRHFLVSGASGLVGGALVPFLTTGGHRVTRLVRRPSTDEGTSLWDPSGDGLDLAAAGDVDAVVHLAGENIAGARWTKAVKQRIRESRARGTRLLCEALARRENKPQVLVSASAIGFYGDRGLATLDEDDAGGEGFLADVCRDWEEATRPAVEAGIRVVHLRFGVVLSSSGGALAKLLLPFRLGLGGRLGNGRQYMSWIGIDDALGAILHAAMAETLTGPVNAVAPEPVTNAEFTAALGHVLGRPTLLPLPAAAAHLALGEMADEMLLASTRVQPTRLLASGFTFRTPNVEDALRHTLGRDRRTEGEKR